MLKLRDENVKKRFSVRRFVIIDSTSLGFAMIRSGIGYDIHRFAEGLKLVLGGLEIAHARGLEGHSDADVLSTRLPTRCSARSAQAT